MSTEDENDAGLVPSQPAALSRSGATALAKRGLSDLCGREHAWELWRSGRELASQDKFAEAIACFERAAILDPQCAEWQWGFTFVLDALHFGSPRNDFAAVNWYRMGAEKGIASAQCRLGAAYCYGLGVDKDYQQAASWYEKAATQGQSEAQCTLGWLYHCGLGVPKNLSLAIYWYRKAAAQQYGTLSQEARIYLGDIYARGDCVPVDPSQANHWYQEAFACYQHLAEQGLETAQYRLGLMHERGQGVEHNLEKAAYWYRKAAEKGNEPARAALAALQVMPSATEVTPEIRSLREVGFDAAVKKSEQRQRILLVEDEKPIRDFIVPILLSAGFDCREAATGQSAIDLLKSGVRINLVLSNFLLPEVDGIRLLLYTKQNHPQIPFVFVTAIDDVAVRKEAVRGGADGFVQKPFEGKQLLAIVHRLLGRTA